MRRTRCVTSTMQIASRNAPALATGDTKTAGYSR